MVENKYQGHTIMNNAPHAAEDTASWVQVLSCQSKQRRSSYRVESGELPGRLHDKNGSAIFDTIIVKSKENAVTATPMQRAARTR